jgi:hypothetical protein
MRPGRIELGIEWLCLSKQWLSLRGAAQAIKNPTMARTTGNLSWDCRINCEDKG